MGIGATGTIKAQSIITTAVNITAETISDEGFSQKNHENIIKNGTSNINFTVNTTEGFTAKYIKNGTGSITFLQGAGRTLVLVDGTAQLTGGSGITASINSVGTTDFLRVNNVVTSNPRIAIFTQQGFRVYGSASGLYYGADNFPAFFNLDSSTGQSDENLLQVTHTKVTDQAPFDCKIESVYFFINEANVEFAVYKSDIDLTNDTLVYHNNDAATIKNDRNISSTIVIKKGDFIAPFVKRPDAIPGYVEAQYFIIAKEVV